MKKSLYSSQQKLLQELLKAVRIEAGFSQVVLSNKLRKSQSFVSKYENGERMLDVLELREVCAALGVPLQHFINRLEEILSARKPQV